MAFGFLALILGFAAFPEAGKALVVADPLQPSRAIVVLGGHVPFRATEATALWKQGWAKEVWLTKGTPSPEDQALLAVGVNVTPEYRLSQQVLQNLGVPADSIRVLDDWDDNTLDELRTVAREGQREGVSRVILVTSKFHTRRVRTLWRRFIGLEPAAIVRPASSDPYDPDGWWRTTRSANIVAREWFGLLNALVGFPVKSARGLR